MSRKQTKRANGEGTIVYEADRKKYRAYLVDPTGKRISKRFDTQTEASHWLAEIRTDIYREQYVPTNDITLGEWLLEYLKAYRKESVRDVTYEGYLNRSQFISPIANYALQDLNQMIMQRFFNDLDMAINSKYGIKRLLNHCFNKAVELGILKTSPLHGVTLPPIPKTEIDVFTQDEVNIILDFLKNDKRYKKYYSFFALAFASGMRVGELCGLKIKDVHENYVYVCNTVKRVNGIVRDSKPKTDSSIRKISLPHDLCKALQDTHGGADTEYVFHTSNLGAHDYANIRTRWGKILKRCGLRERNIHTTRHTHATLLIYAGVPITEISRRLGHSKVSVTLDYYAHYFQEYDSRIADKVSTMFKL